jgi:hypothetical protein
MRPIGRRRGRLRRHDRNRRKRWQRCSLCACGGALLLCRTLPRWRNGQIIRVQRGHLRHWRRCIARRSRRVPVVGRIRRGRCRLGSCRRLGGRRRRLRACLVVHRRQSHHEQPDSHEDSDEQRAPDSALPGAVWAEVDAGDGAVPPVWHGLPRCRGFNATTFSYSATAFCKSPCFS